jgi:D-alanyl-D-alanine carboxypeptidase
MAEADMASASDTSMIPAEAAPGDALPPDGGEPISIALAAMATRTTPGPQAVAPETAEAEPAPPATIDPASLVVLTFAPAADEEAGAGLASLARLGRVEASQPVVEAPAVEPAETVSRTLSTSSPRLWAATLGRFSSRDAAERALIRSALADLGHLDTAPRRIERSSGGFEASFVGLTETGATAACDRLRARGQTCEPVGP